MSWLLLNASNCTPCALTPEAMVTIPASLPHYGKELGQGNGLNHCCRSECIVPGPTHSYQNHGLLVPMVKTNTGAMAFRSCAPSLWNNLTLGVRPFSYLNCNLQETSQNTSLWLGLSPHAHQHAWWPVDVMELLRRLYCWTLIRMSRHWAWLCQGYWRYRNLFDWLIDWWTFFALCMCLKHILSSLHCCCCWCYDQSPWIIYMHTSGWPMNSQQMGQLHLS